MVLRSAQLLFHQACVEEKDLVRVLAKGARFQLVRLCGGVRNLRAEIVESTLDVPFTAISHVWADSLGILTPTLFNDTN